MEKIISVSHLISMNRGTKFGKKNCRLGSSIRYSRVDREKALEQGEKLNVVGGPAWRTGFPHETVCCHEGRGGHFCPEISQRLVEGQKCPPLPEGLHTVEWGKPVLNAGQPSTEDIFRLQKSCLCLNIPHFHDSIEYETLLPCKTLFSWLLSLGRK